MEIVLPNYEAEGYKIKHERKFMQILYIYLVCFHNDNLQ